MKRLLFHIFIAIPRVHYTISNNDIGKFYDYSGNEKELSELNSIERKFSLVAAAVRCRSLENVVIKVSVIDHMHRLMDRFIEKLCRSNKNVKEAVTKIKTPPEIVFPIRLIRARKQAKTLPKLKEDVKKHISTFKRVYRQLMAILENAHDSDDDDDFAIFKTSLSASGSHSNEEIALGGAELKFQLSLKIHTEEPGKEVNWNDKEAVIEALRYCDISGKNVILVAEALHDVRSVQLT